MTLPMRDFEPSAPVPDDPAARDEKESGSAVALVNVALNHLRLLVLLPLVAMILAGLLALVVGPSYVAESTFKPESPDLPSGGLFTMATQFGLDLASFTEGEGVEYYARLVTSREILSDVLRTEFPRGDGEGGADTATLLALYGVEADTEEERIWKGVERLRKQVTVSIDHGAGVISMSSEAPTRELATAINGRILELLNRFNLEKKQSQARAERAFVEAQTQEARQELEAAEKRLAEFLSQNRRYEASPELVNEVERLRRQVDLRQQVYTGLAQAREQARLDEVRNTPVFTVLDRPEGSARQVGGVIPSMFMGLLLGVVVAALWAFLREYIQRQRVEHPAEFRKLQQRLGRLRPTRLAGRRG